MKKTLSKNTSFSYDINRKLQININFCRFLDTPPEIKKKRFDSDKVGFIVSEEISIL